MEHWWKSTRRVRRKLSRDRRYSESGESPSVCAFRSQAEGHTYLFSRELIEEKIGQLDEMLEVRIPAARQVLLTDGEGGKV